MNKETMQDAAFLALGQLVAEEKLSGKARVKGSDLLKAFKRSIGYHLMVPPPSDDDIIEAFESLNDRHPGLLVGVIVDD